MLKEYLVYGMMLNSVLYEMHKEISVLESGEVVIFEGESGSTVNDEELAADLSLGKTAVKALAEYPSIHSAVVEGLGTSDLNADGSIVAYVDPLDASLYYKLRGDVKGFYPYAGVVTFIENVSSPLFKDIIASGVVNYPSQDKWLSEIYFGVDGDPVRQQETGLNFKVAKPYQGGLNLTKCPVIGEMYYPDNRDRIVRAFADMKGYLRSPGCAAVEMASVSSGQTAAFICISQKAHELGAAYKIVKNAGGVVVDWQGNDFADKVYDFGAQYDVVLACNQAVADDILERLHRTGPKED